MSIHKSLKIKGGLVRNRNVLRRFERLEEIARIYGYEVDGLEYIIRDGLPFVTGEDGASGDIEILGLGLGTNFEADHGVRA